MIYVKGLPLCLWVQDLVQHILVTENPMKFGMGQSMSYHIIECLVVLLTCSSTNNNNQNGMLKTSSWCLLDTTL
jgi:hypothetical protein